MNDQFTKRPISLGDLKKRLQDIETVERIDPAKRSSVDYSLHPELKFDPVVARARLHHIEGFDRLLSYAGCSASELSSCEAEELITSWSAVIYEDFPAREILMPTDGDVRAAAEEARLDTALMPDGQVTPLGKFAAEMKRVYEQARDEAERLPEGEAIEELVASFRDIITANKDVAGIANADEARALVPLCGGLALTAYIDHASKIREREPLRFQAMEKVDDFMKALGCSRGTAHKVKTHFHGLSRTGTARTVLSLSRVPEPASADGQAAMDKLIDEQTKERRADNQGRLRRSSL